MKRVVVLGLVFCFVFGALAPVHGRAEASKILVVGLQTGSTLSASDERIILANVSGTAVDLTGYKLEYFSASAQDFTKPSRTIALQGLVQSNAEFVLATIAGPDVHQQFSATLAATGGHLRLSNANEVLDVLGWGVALHPAGQAISAPAPGALLRRQLDAQGTYLNSGDNAKDFSPPAVATPNSSIQIWFNELLPNPVGSDEALDGEFIELYNPGDTMVSLQGYRLTTGPSFTKSSVLKAQEVPPNGYVVLYKSQTNITLSNNGGSLQLWSPSGQVIDSVTFTKGQEGAAWARSMTEWQWTNTPTPGSQNVLTTLMNRESRAETPNKISKPRSTTSKTATKSKNGKTTKTIKQKTKSNEREQKVKPPLHSGVVAGVGGAAVLYGSYEYKQDVYDFFRKFRANRKNR